MVNSRVLSVIRQWVGRHWYDFENDPELLERLKEFLLGIQSHMLRKYVVGILAHVDRQCKVTEEDEEERRRKKMMARRTPDYGPKPPPVSRNVDHYYYYRGCLTGGRVV